MFEVKIPLGQRAVAAVVLAVLALLPLTEAGAAGPAAAKPWSGVLQPVVGGLEQLHGVRRASLEIGWDALEPVRGTVDASYVRRQLARYTTLRHAGFDVVLDLGLQYPPAWVFRLHGQTRFQNQYGDSWHGGLGEDVPNAVFNPVVRDAQAAYVRLVARAFRGHQMAAVRVGGLLSGELRYPGPVYGGHTDAVWAYGAQAEAEMPYPGWRPGRDRARDRASLQTYFDALTGYESWLLKQVRAALPAAEPQVLLPGWGLRPGQLEEAVGTGLRGRTPAERGGMIASGSDWRKQVAVATRSRAVVYTTWLDAPAGGSTPQTIPPVAYLAGLASASGAALAGENTSGGGQSALLLCLRRVREHRLRGFMWMNDQDLVARRDGLGRTEFSRQVAML